MSIIKDFFDYMAKSAQKEAIQKARDEQFEGLRELARNAPSFLEPNRRDGIMLKDYDPDVLKQFFAVYDMQKVTINKNDSFFTKVGKWLQNDYVERKTEERKRLIKEEERRYKEIRDEEKYGSIYSSNSSDDEEVRALKEEMDWLEHDVKEAMDRAEELETITKAAIIYAATK